MNYYTMYKRVKRCGGCRAPLDLCACGWHKQVPPNRNPPPPPPCRNAPIQAMNAGRYDFSNPFKKATAPKYNNSHLCGECTGAGCKQCYDTLKLRRQGSATFPLSHAVSGCVPPAIQRSYAAPVALWFTPHKLRQWKTL